MNAVLFSAKTALAVLLALMMLQVPLGSQVSEDGAVDRAGEISSTMPADDQNEPLDDSQGGTRQDHIDVNDPLGTYYPGDESVTFTFWVTESYTAPASVDPFTTGVWWGIWPTDPYGTTEDSVYDVELDIKGIVDEKGNTASVVDWVYDDAWNDGIAALPINFTNGRTWMADDGDDNQVSFRLNIGTQLTPGTYFLLVEVDYKVCTSYNNADPTSSTNPKLSSDSHATSIEFEIRSGVEPAPFDETIPAGAYSDAGAPMPLYAGAQFQEVRIGVTAAVGDIDTIVGTPSAPSGAAITIDSRTVSSEITTLSGGASESLKYRVYVADNQAPTVVTSTLIIQYTREEGGHDVEIRETLRTQWVVEFTPLLEPQDSDSDTAGDYLTVYVDDLTQGEDYKGGLTIGFTNTGNVDLDNLEITLDLTNALYLFTSDFYYDEGAQATKVSFPPLTATVTSLGVGYSTNIPFFFDVRPNIPPGKYIVPITYEGWYFDDGTTGAATAFVKTDEAMHYNTIMNVRNQFWTDPFVYLYIIDDNVNVNTRVVNANATAKDEGILIDVEITNEEAYTLTDVTAYVECGEGTPFDNPRGGELTELEGFRIGDFAGGSTVTATFKADVRGGLTEAEYMDVVVLLEGEDELGFNYTLAGDNPIRTRGYIEVFPVPPVIPAPPMLIVQDVHTNNVIMDANQQYDLTVTVRNIGGQNASSVRVLLIDDHDLLHPVQAIQTVPTAIMTDGTEAEAVVTFQMLVDPNVELGEYYEATVLFMFEDEYGNIYEFGEGTGTDVTVRMKEEPEPEPEPEPVLTLPLATLLLGILVLLSFLIGGILISKGLRNMGQGTPARKKKAHKEEDELDDLAPAPAPAPLPSQAPAPAPAPAPQRGALPPGPAPATLPQGPAPGGQIDYEPPPPDDY
jgi:hypothetical protein